MIAPVCKDDAFLADLAAAQPGDGFALWWLGQSGFLLKYRNRHLLFDPYLSDSLTRKYARTASPAAGGTASPAAGGTASPAAGGTDKPHERMTEIVVDPARLDSIDVVTSSHSHTDHLDAETLLPLIRANPALQLVVPGADRTLVAQRLDIEADRPIGLDDGRDVQLAGFRLHGVPAAHETVDRDEHGRCKFLGYVVQMGRWTVYHAGDTVRYDGMTERLRTFNIDVALLPINGRVPQRRVPGNLSGPEAAELAHQLGAKLVIPCHYEMFRFNTASPQPFVEACARLGQPCRVLKCGQRWTTLQGAWQS